MLIDFWVVSMVLVNECCLKEMEQRNFWFKKLLKMNFEKNGQFGGRRDKTDIKQNVFDIGVGFGGGGLQRA